MLSMPEECARPESSRWYSSCSLAALVSCIAAILLLRDATLLTHESSVSCFIVMDITWRTHPRTHARMGEGGREGGRAVLLSCWRRQNRRSLAIIISVNTVVHAAWRTTPRCRRCRCCVPRRTPRSTPGAPVPSSWQEQA
jgi:hypothetical protein